MELELLADIHDGDITAWFEDVIEDAQGVSEMGATEVGRPKGGSSFMKS